MSELPSAVAEVVDLLANLPGTNAVVLGGSHVLGSADAHSDWDVGLYYRGSIDLTALVSRGTVYPPGSWGRIMNGGAWLQSGNHKVDVILRDLDVVEHWTRRAEHGEFEVDSLLGYLAGIPTYTLTAELASCRLLHGEMPAAPLYPAKLTAKGLAVWRFCRTFSLDCARMHAARGNAAGALGHAARAVMEEGHAILCERGEWVCNEKRLIRSTGLASVQRSFARIPDGPGLIDWVDGVAESLGVPVSETSPWTDKGRQA